MYNLNTLTSTVTKRT